MCNHNFRCNFSVKKKNLPSYYQVFTKASVLFLYPTIALYFSTIITCTRATAVAYLFPLFYQETTVILNSIDLNLTLIYSTERKVLKNGKKKNLKITKTFNYTVFAFIPEFVVVAVLIIII